MKSILLPATTIVLMLLSLSLLPLRLRAQSQDMNVWTRFSMKYDLSKTTRLALEEEFRFDENGSTLEQNHTELGISHDLSKRLDAGLYYRFILEPDVDRRHSIGHRGWIQMEYRIIDGDIRLAFRNRLQATYEDIFSSETGHTPEWYNRYKLAAEFKPRKTAWIPECSLEFWHFLNPDGPAFINKYRASAGVQYRPSKHFRWDLFYIFQQDIQVRNPGIDHIFGLAVTYMIN